MNNEQHGKVAAKAVPAEKATMHPRNPHRGRYDFKLLIAGSPELAAFVSLNEYGNESVDFTNPSAVRALNRALLKQVYGIVDWDIPSQYLCPPIPGRADHVHFLADLLADGGEIPRGNAIRVLDIGVGANCVYPLIGHREYGWQFVGTEIDPIALANAQRILDANQGMSDAITLRLQTSPDHIFKGVLQANEVFDLSMCNPPFHASLAEARSGSKRKWKNLGRDAEYKDALGKNKIPVLNFGGQSSELCCEGGEEAFVCRMIAGSAQFPRSCKWFTTLISKSSSLPGVYRAIKYSGALQNKTLEMAQGQKKSRIVAWTFLDKNQLQALAKCQL
jgi:23S rRNA (adenine1618-N6)-methyltransferase